MRIIYNDLIDSLAVLDGREAVLPLTNQDVMADLASQITKHMPINQNQIVLRIEGEQINSYITEAIRNGVILTDRSRGIT